MTKPAPPGLKVIVPSGEEENIRRNANRVVKNVIAPAFAEKQRAFKGEKSKNKDAIARVFKQENKAPKIQTVDTQTVIRQADEAKKNRDNKRVQNVEKKKEEVIKYMIYNFGG